ncbi:uncharacterized protein E0L32_011755 [Thyridium curvatum]|uniref:Transcription factor domain-containing protein n=1 Tax=Thyridium curvatum TaxID=1093900 RepID=A0A507BHX5_9PEZI|nr:uncharacterized protein E0L32_011755 [Thyridium curvatum]TPX18344.1 hypothetical protein E0L32_011755 [Thyridium curvatum]
MNGWAAPGRDQRINPGDRSLDGSAWRIRQTSFAPRSDGRLPVEIDCSREKVRIKRHILQNDDQVQFLHSVVADLERLPYHAALTTTIARVRDRILHLQFGDDAAPHDGQEAGPSASDTGDTAETEAPAEQQVPDTQVGFRKFRDPSLLTALEHLAWGRTSGKCFPHKACGCKHRRHHAEPHAEGMPSMLGRHIDAGGAEAAVPDPDDARKLVHFHIQHLAWHHNCWHSPTFLAECETFWATGTYNHPLWLALYLSVLSATVFGTQHSEKAKAAIGVDTARLPSTQQLFSSMITVLYRHHFLQDLTLYSVQAIAISTEVAHNLGESELNATLIYAGIRISECLGLHRIDDPPALAGSTEDWETRVEREVGKRVWCQLTIQDHFAIPFTETYGISPGQVSTSYPSNADDRDLVHQPENVPTVSSYCRNLVQLAVLMPELADGLGTAKQQLPLKQQYDHVLHMDRRVREVVNQFPPFFLKGDLEPEASIPWLQIARKSLAITAAEKIIMIHRPFLFRSFQAPAYAFTRKTCTAAATTILREHNALTEADEVSIWTHTAFCITAAVILCLEIYSTPGSDTTTAEHHRETVRAARQRLASRSGDLLAQRGVTLVDVLLNEGSQYGEQALDQRVSMGFDWIASVLYPAKNTSSGGVSAEQLMFAQDSHGPGPGSDFSPGAWASSDVGVGAGFDVWFNSVFFDNAQDMVL